MPSGVRIVKKYQIQDALPAPRKSKGEHLVGERELVAVVKSWIQEFKRRSGTPLGFRPAQPNEYGLATALKH
jgi:hypothetical protein